jgi:hypothetical protein
LASRDESTGQPADEQDRAGFGSSGRRLRSAASHRDPVVAVRSAAASRLDHLRPSQRGVEVVGLGAWCDNLTEDEYREELAGSAWPPEVMDQSLETFTQALHFRVEQFATLSDGRRRARLSTSE